jgi:hypothetical protein
MALWVLGGVVALQLAGDLIRLRIPAMNVLFFRTLPGLVTPRERDRIASSTWYLVGAERGVGRTSASGTSSCAAVVASIHSGRILPGTVSVEMDGGRMEVTVSEGLDVLLRGPVEEVSRGVLAKSFVERLNGT